MNASKGLLKGAAFADEHKCRGLPDHAARAFDSINIVWDTHLQAKAKNPDVKDVRVMELSQSCWRAANIGHMMPTLTTSSELFYFPRARTIAPIEHFLKDS